MKKYLQAQGEGDTIEQSMEAREPFLKDIKKFLKEELQGIRADLKELKMYIKALDARLMKTEG